MLTAKIMTERNNEGLGALGCGGLGVFVSNSSKHPAVREEIANSVFSQV
jgi:hypothetical protein